MISKDNRPIEIDFEDVGRGDDDRPFRSRADYRIFTGASLAVCLILIGAYAVASPMVALDKGASPAAAEMAVLDDITEIPQPQAVANGPEVVADEAPPLPARSAEDLRDIEPAAGENAPRGPDMQPGGEVIDERTPPQPAPVATSGAAPGVPAEPPAAAPASEARAPAAPPAQPPSQPSPQAAEESGQSPPPSPPKIVPPEQQQGAASAEGVTTPAGGQGADMYFDSVVLPPSGPMAKTAGPRKVDPTLEPASKFVVVTKNAGAGEKEAVLVSAQRALELKRYDSALDLYEQLYKKNQRDPRIVMGRAIALQNLGRKEAAIATYEELLALDPGNTNALVNMMGLVAADYPEVALRRLLDMRQKYPNSAGLSAQIGLTHAALGNTAEALQYLGTAASLDPTNASHLYNMAVITDRNGDIKSAVALYEKALQVDAVHGGTRSVPRESIYDRLSVLRSR